LEEVGGLIVEKVYPNENNETVKAGFSKNCQVIANAYSVTATVVAITANDISSYNGSMVSKTVLWMA
jgi:hypothetical protein